VVAGVAQRRRELVREDCRLRDILCVGQAVERSSHQIIEDLVVLLPRHPGHRDMEIPDHLVDGQQVRLDVSLLPEKGEGLGEVPEGL